MHDVPELNTVIIYERSFCQRLNNRIFIPTVFRHNQQIDLNGIYIDDAYNMPLRRIEEMLRAKTTDLRTGKDRQTNRVVNVFGTIAGPIMKNRL